MDDLEQAAYDFMNNWDNENEKTYEYKGEIITETQISNLIRDRKYWLNAFQVEVRNNLKDRKKVKKYERIIGFLITLIIVLVSYIVIK